MLRQLKTNPMAVATKILQFEKENALEIRHRLFSNYNCPETELESTNHLIFQEINETFRNTNFEKLTEKNIWTTFNFLAPKKLRATRSKMKQNFNLTEKDFDKLKFNLQNGDEKFFEHIFLSHFEDCIKFLIRKFRIIHPVAYDVTMETLLLFRHKLIQDKIQYGNVRFLFTQMASQQYLKSKEKEKHKDNYIPTSLEEESSEDRMVSAEEIQILSRSLAKLGDKCRVILTKFYYDKISLKQISETFELPPATVRKQKERCLLKLKTLFKQHTV